VFIYLLHDGKCSVEEEEEEEKKKKKRRRRKEEEEYCICMTHRVCSVTFF